jgi:hypothetical protein
MHQLADNHEQDVNDNDIAVHIARPIQKRREGGHPGCRQQDGDQRRMLNAHVAAHDIPDWPHRCAEKAGDGRDKEVFSWVGFAVHKISSVEVAGRLL